MRANDSSVRVVIGAVDAFERLRHPAKVDSESRVDRAAYQDALSIIENAITSRILGFFAVKDRLQDVVDAANVQTKDGSWTPPTEHIVSTTLARIGGLQHRRIGYDLLSNPEWIQPPGSSRRTRATEAVQRGLRQTSPTNIASRGLLGANG